MSQSPFEKIGEGAVFGGLSALPEPTYELIDPVTAPTSLLGSVHVDTEGRRLVTSTSLGEIAVEVYWGLENDPDGTEYRGDFFPALDVDLDPGAADNPQPTRRFPYVILPNGALYEAVVRVPWGAVDNEWSDTFTESVGSKFASYTGVSLGEFRRAFPGVEVDLPEGNYSISAELRKKPAFGIAARVEGGEPLARIHEIRGDTVRYKETLSGGFARSALLPETAVSVLNSRITIRQGGEADRQRLQFSFHDGFQRTGQHAERHGGEVEIIVLQAEAVEFTGFTFTPFRLPDFTQGGGYYGSEFGPLTRGGMYEGGALKSSGGLFAGETRYRPPETVNVGMSGVRKLRAIAAFCFGLAGADSRT